VRGYDEAKKLGGWDAWLRVADEVLELREAG
jgi:hypothetical protein